MTNRVFVIQTLIVCTVLIFSIRLFNIQILDEDYEIAAENNVVQKIVEYPYRGLMMDRNDSIIVYNSPVYDLMVVPREAEVRDTVAFCALLGIEKEEFKECENPKGGKVGLA